MEEFRIICKSAPSIFFEDKKIAINYFRQFGRIKKIMFKIKSGNIIIVEFANQEGLLKALASDCMYEDYKFEIVEANPSIRKKRVTKEADPEWIPDPEVLEELNAMGGGPSLGLKKYNLRPEVMDTGVSKEKPTKLLKRQWPATVQKITPKKSKAATTLKHRLTEEQLDLVDIIKKPALSIEEKYKTLDARDKLIRYLLRKNGNKSSATQGTCPDMCPEKERVLRVIQHQVSIYEQDSLKEMDPSLAVKQYSRSSADQESPLPHELRPVSVLQMTMSYLVHKIMSLGDNADVNIGDWYHFLWDRTRGIRKDITQQELCSQGSVLLVEQCARFHIHCSARLVAEDPSVFDQKINTENLTKCLQTLKYMYNDLRLKGEKCPNEAEFRAYIILLNLNDGNFMSEVQKLPIEIQKSHEVRTAIEVYSALDQNNFIKFFKLVNATTYLNACILMRYFMQVRIRAVTILLKCYAPRLTKVVYPLDELAYNLSFESVGHAIEFSQSCGLSINAASTGVILDKNMFSSPDFTYTSLDRSIDVVESKRKNLSVGQVVCGNILPPKDFEYHLPENSFTDKGILKTKYLNSVNLEPLLRYQEEISTEISSPITRSNRVSPRAKNPYVFINAAGETNPSKSFAISDQKKYVPTISPFKSNVFSQGHKSSNEVSESSISESKIFHGHTSESLPNVQIQEEENISIGETNVLNDKRIPQPSFTHTETKNIFTNAADGTKSIFETANIKNKSIFDTSNVNTKSTFGVQSYTQSKSIFEVPSINSQSCSIFKQPSMVEPQTAASGASIFNTKSGIFGKCTDELLPADVHHKEDIDFKEIKWDIDSPTDPSEPINEVQTVFFKPTVVSHKTPSNTVGGFNFPGFTFTPLPSSKVENDNVTKQKVYEEAKKEDQKEKQRKLDEEKQQEEREQLRKLEIERRIAEKLKEEEKREKMRKDQEKQHEERKLLEIREVVMKLVLDVIDAIDTQIQKENLEEFKRKMNKKMLQNVFQNWHRHTVKKKNWRKVLNCTPPWMCSRNPQEEAAQLETISQKLTLGDIKRYRLGRALDLSYEESTVTEKIDFSKLSKIISQRYCELGRKFFKDIYWKGVISLPDSSEMSEGRLKIEETLQKLFGWRESNKSILLLDRYKLNEIQSVKYCIEKQNTMDIEQCDANGFIFIADNFNQALCNRILENIKNLGIFVSVPVVIILQQHPPSSMNLKLLVEQGVICNYLVLVDNFSPKRLVDNVETGLKFLLMNAQSPPPVLLDTMNSILTRNLCTEIWRRANSFCKWSSIYKQCLKNPNVVINLYNDALAKLSSIVLNKSCYEFANFPAIFKELIPSEIPDYLPCDYKYFPSFCKEESYFNLISEILKKLKFKTIERWPPKNQNDLENILLNYCTEIYEDPMKPFYKVLSIFLNKIEHSGDFEEISNVLWSSVIEILALEKIREINFSLEGTKFFNKSVFNKVVVIYNPQALDEYTNTDWFYMNHPIIREFIKNSSYLPIKENKRSYDLNSEDIDRVILNARSKLKDTDTSGINQKLSEFKCLLADLEESIEINRKISSNLNETLNNLLEGND